MKPFGFASVIVAALLACARHAAADAPTALYNKTVVLTWTEHRVQRADSGEVHESTTVSNFAIYISTAGRLFSEFTRRNPRSGRSNSSLQGPDGATTTSGMGASARSTRFEGRQLISDSKMRSGARRILVEFDGGFTGCALMVIYGKEGGAPQYHRAMDGRMYHILSTDVISPRCQIKAGNAFANN